MYRFFQPCEGCTDVKMPERSTKRSAGYDFYAPEDIEIPSIWSQLFKKCLFLFSKFEPVELKPTVVWTNVKAKMNKNEYLALYNRSSNPLKFGLLMSNGVGVIDADYYGNKTNDGNIGFQFWNISPFPVIIKKGAKIGQGVFHTYLRVQNDMDEDKPERVGGHGSTTQQSEE